MDTDMETDIDMDMESNDLNDYVQKSRALQAFIVRLLLENLIFKR